MKTGLLKFKRNLYKQLLSVFSLSALLFVFEACYGTPQGFNNDVMISGNIRSADSQNPVEGILINGFKYTAERHDSLMRAGMGALTLSIDGQEKSHNWLRNNNKSFEKTDTFSAGQE